MKNILVITFLFNWRYQPIYVNKEISQMTFNEIVLTGDKKINNQILSLSIDEKDDRLNNMFLNSEEIIVET